MFASFRGPELDFSVAAAGDEEVGGLLNERAAVYRVKEEFSLLVLFLLKLLLPLEGEFRRVVGANGFSMAEEVSCTRISRPIPLEKIRRNISSCSVPKQNRTTVVVFVVVSCCCLFFLLLLLFERRTSALD